MQTVDQRFYTPRYTDEEVGVGEKAYDESYKDKADKDFQHRAQVLGDVVAVLVQVQHDRSKKHHEQGLAALAEGNQHKCGNDENQQRPSQLSIQRQVYIGDDGHSCEHTDTVHIGKLITQTYTFLGHTHHVPQSVEGIGVNHHGVAGINNNLQEDGVVVQPHIIVVEYTHTDENLQDAGGSKQNNVIVQCPEHGEKAEYIECAYMLVEGTYVELEIGEYQHQHRGDQCYGKTTCFGG